ncbi:hypothetical protein BH24ACI4_BH24ACI4_04710 [soil metagenome]
MLRTLLSRGMSPDVMNWQRQTLLHHVCGQQDPAAAAIDEAAILIDAGANVSARDEEYRSTPLGWAARTNAIDMVRFVLPRCPTNLPDDELWATPLQWAERRQHQEIAEILRRHGAGRSIRAASRRSTDIEVSEVSEVGDRSRRPVLDLQPLHLSTVLLVAGHQRQSAGQCVRRNQDVDVADRFAFKRPACSRPCRRRRNTPIERLCQIQKDEAVYYNDRASRRSTLRRGLHREAFDEGLR